MGIRSGLPVLTCPSQCTSPQSSQFELRITIYWISLETIVNAIKFLFETSLPRIVGHEMLAVSVLQFCRAEHPDVAPS